VGARAVDAGGACGDANNSSCKVLFLSHFDLSLNGMTVFHIKFSTNFRNIVGSLSNRYMDRQMAIVIGAAQCSKHTYCIFSNLIRTLFTVLEG